MKILRERILTYRSTLFLQVLLLVNYIFSFLWQAYLTGVLGNIIYGKLFMGDKLMFTLACLLDLGYLPTAAAKWQSVGKEERQQLFSCVIICKLLTTLLFIGVFFLFNYAYLHLELTDKINYLFFFLSTVAERLVADFVYRAIHKMYLLLLFNLLTRLSISAGLLYFVRDAASYAAVALIFAGGNLLLLLLSLLPLLYQHFKLFTRVSVAKVKAVARQALLLSGDKWALLGFNLITFLACSSGKLSSESVSYLVLLDLLMLTGRKVVFRLGESFYVHLVHTRDFRWYTVRALCLFSAVVAVLFILIIQARLFLTLLFGEHFQGATQYLQIMAVGAIFISFDALLAYPLLAAQGLLKQLNRACGSGIIMYAAILGILYFSDCLNALNLVLAYTAALFGEFVFNLFFLQKYHLFHSNGYNEERSVYEG